MFNKNFFHLALGFVFVLSFSLALVLGVGFFDSEIKKEKNKASIFNGEAGSNIDNLNIKNPPTSEWPPQLE